MRIMNSLFTNIVSADASCLTHTPRWGIAAAKLQNETILLIGGVGAPTPSAKQSSNTAEVFFPKVYALGTGAR